MAAANGFAAAVMAEVGVDLSGHEPRDFEALDETPFDLLISLTPEAQHRSVELTRTTACAIEYWPTMDPSVTKGSRETILTAYRELRHMLTKRIKDRFGLRPRLSG